MAEYINRDLIVKNSMLHTWKKADLLRAIKEAPDADVVEVKHGEWTKTYPDNPNNGDYYCSNCKCGVDIATGEETPIDRGFIYCFNCGANMDGENNV